VIDRAIAFAIDDAKMPAATASGLRAASEGRGRFVYAKEDRFGYEDFTNRV
jgi:hypothetical protein